MNAFSSFEHAKQTYVHGYLAEAQLEGEQGYLRFLYSSPSWARKFQLLEANAMAWRGLDDEILTTLADDRVAWTDRGDNIQRLALETLSLTRLHRLDDADRMLIEADRVCALGYFSECGSVLRDHALLMLERGRTEQAKSALMSTLSFALADNDEMLEATALLNLGTTYSRQQGHEDAIHYYELSVRKATKIGANDLLQRAFGSEGFEQYVLGNLDKAVDVFIEAEKSAESVGDVSSQTLWLILLSNVYADAGKMALAEQSALHALKLARRFNRKQSIIDASEALAQIYVYRAKPEDANRYAGEALKLVQQTGNRLDILYCHMIQGESAALLHDWSRADSLLHEVVAASESQNRMRWEAQHTLATMYETVGQAPDAKQSYKAAIALVEGARADLRQDISRLTFLNNAARIYDDYIHFLVTQGRSDEALEAADWSRARTLQQGLGLISSSASLKPPPLRATEIARNANATLLFYWMGEKESYLWAVSPEKTMFVKLPPKSDIVARIERYRRTLLALKDPVKANGGQGDKDGRDLYEMLIAPVAGVASPGRPVVLFTDGAMTQLNFETLLAGGAATHYWIDDATISSAPSMHLFAAKARSERSTGDKLLLLGDSLTADPALPRLPMSALEMQRVKANFNPSDEAVFAGAQATPLTYISSKPEQFSYIHFVAHGTANSTDPLESAVILSKDNGAEDSYKLYAREILRHPIAARLVTISACNSSGSASFAGEGVIGLSWAFLRAGAHNTIGALWDVSDASTPDLMDHLYAGLQRNEPPATALREAKLVLLHSNSSYSKPFYWAPFQLYAGH